MYSDVHIRPKIFQIKSKSINNSIGLSILIVAIRSRVYHVHTLERNEKQCLVSLNDDLVNRQAT